MHTPRRAFPTLVWGHPPLPAALLLIGLLVCYANCCRQLSAITMLHTGKNEWVYWQCDSSSFCLGAYNTWSTLYDRPKVSCCSYVIIVRTLPTARPLQTILTSMMCIKWSRQTTLDSCLPLQCYIQECVGVQYHSQVRRGLATIHISCILLLCCILSPTESFAVQSAFCDCYIIGAVSLS